MTIYNSYEEAKIANPESEIYKGRECGFKVVSNAPTSHFANGWKLCKPADHCMTVEKFLADDHKLSKGDLLLCSEGFVHPVLFADDFYNEPSKSDDKYYILRAAALKPRDNDYAMSVMEKKVKVEYVKVHNSEAIKAVMEGSIDYWREINGSYSNLTMDSSLQEFCCAVRRDENEIDERQEFIEAYAEAVGVNWVEINHAAGVIYDSGKFKLVTAD